MRGIHHPNRTIIVKRYPKRLLQTNFYLIYNISMMTVGWQCFIAFTIWRVFRLYEPNGSDDCGSFLLFITV